VDPGTPDVAFLNSDVSPNIVTPHGCEKKRMQSCPAIYGSLPLIAIEEQTYPLLISTEAPRKALQANMTPGNCSHDASASLGAANNAGPPARRLKIAATELVYIVSIAEKFPIPAPASPE
jgi:hypothetical protein